MARGKDGRGFTLVELLVVIGIIIAISLMTLPAVIGVLKSRALKNGARIVQGAIDVARAEATKKNRQVRVSFETYTNTDGKECNRVVVTDLGGNPGDPADDTRTSAQDLPEGILFMKGSNEAMAFRLLPEGVLELYSHDDPAQTTLAADVITDDFEADSEANHDFMLVDPNGESAWGNAVPATGRVQFRMSFD